MPFGGSHVLRVGGQNGFHAVRGAEGVCHPLQDALPGAAAGQRHGLLGRAGSFENFLCRHGSALLSVCGKAGACRFALGNVIEQLRVRTVGNDHVGPAGGHHPGGAELGGHAAGAQCRAGPVGQRHHVRGDLFHQRDERCIRVGVGVGGVQAVDVAQQHQQLGLGAAADDGGQRIVIPNGECEIIWATREKPDFMRVYAA